MHSLSAFLAAQEKAFAHAFDYVTDYPIGVRAPELARTSFSFSSTIQWDANSPARMVFSRTGGVLRECWVHVDYGDYRPAFLKFLEREFGLAKREVPSAEHVDHVFNRGLARQAGLQYVRLALLRGYYNSKYGATIEKNLMREQHGKSIYLMDGLILMKLLCIPVPASLKEFQEQRPHIVKRFVAAGVCTKEVLIEMALDGIVQLYSPLAK